MMAKKNTAYSARRLTTEDAADDFALGEHTEIDFAHRSHRRFAVATIQRHRIISGPTATVNRGSVGITPTTRHHEEGRRRKTGGDGAITQIDRRNDAVAAIFAIPRMTDFVFALRTGQGS